VVIVAEPDFAADSAAVAAVAIIADADASRALLTCWYALASFADPSTTMTWAAVVFNDVGDTSDAWKLLPPIWIATSLYWAVTTMATVGELDAAGHTDALKFPLLLTSNVIAADVELDQRPVIPDADCELPGKSWTITLPVTIAILPAIAGEIKLIEHGVGRNHI
jgi:hypothetical protein